jgi:hypothetical protein
MGAILVERRHRVQIIQRKVREGGSQPVVLPADADMVEPGGTSSQHLLFVEPSGGQGRPSKPIARFPKGTENHSVPRL